MKQNAYRIKKEEKLYFYIFYCATIFIISKRHNKRREM